MSLNQQQTYGISEDIKMKKNNNNSNSSTRTSIDQAHNRPSVMNQSHLSLKSLLDLRSITNKQDINHNSNFDKDGTRYSIADQPLTKLSLTLPSLTNEQQQQQQNIYFSDMKYILLLASFVCTILQFYNSNSYSWWWYISLSWWGLYSLFTVRFFSIHHAPFFCRLGQCSVIFFCASMITKINFQDIYLSIMHLFNNLFMTLNHHYHHHNSNNNINKSVLFYFQQIISSLSSLSSSSSSSSSSSTLVLFNNEWSDYGIILLWMGSYGMFHMVQRLCNHYQTRQQLFNALQHQSQQKVDNYLNDEMNVRQQFIDTLTREMQEAALMVLSTLEQFSPLTVLQHTHELLSPCSLPVPVVNISAIHTVVFEMGQMGSHLRLIASLLRRQKQQINKLDEKDDMMDVNNTLITTTTTIQREFDIGELIQTVGDALAAMASKLGISFILYHMDNGLHCVNVLGDESAIKYGLMILLRNIMEGCTPGASIEVGLNIESHGQHRIQVTFDILQSRSLAIPQSIATSELKLNVFTTESIRYSHGTLSIGKVNDISTRYLVLYNLPSGSDNTQKRLIMERSLLDLRNKVQYASEPTLKELIDFIEKLKGKRMILYATERSIFAKHVTSCLASWNVDISHIPTSTITSIMTSHSSSSSTTTSNLSPSLTAMSTGSTTTSISSTSSSLPGAPPSMKTPTPATEEEHIHSIPPTFLLIDDDINTLDKLLQDYRNQHLQQQQQQQQQQQHHHQQHMATTTPITPSSSISLTSIQQELANNTSSSSSSTRKSRRQQKTMAIIYFSYLKDYRRVREVIMQSVSVGIQPPRVIIIPKPAGPRRFLTALHMGWNDSIIDPQFAPMATSPLNCPPHQHYAVAQAMTSPASFLYSTGSTALTPPTPNESIKRSSSPGGSSVSRHEESHINYFSPRPTSTTTTTTNTNTTTTTSNDTNNNGNLGKHSFGGSGGTATNRSPPHHLSTTTTTTASTTTTTITNPLVSSSPSTGLTGAASASSSSSSLPALVSSANANSRRRLRSKSSTFHPPNRRMVDLTFPSSPLAIDSKLQQDSHYYQHHHPNGFTPLNSIDLEALTTTAAKQRTSLSSDIDNNNIGHPQANLGIGIDIPIHDQLIDSLNLDGHLHDNNNSTDINDMTSPLRISINSSMNDQQQLPSATTATTTTSSSLLIHHNDNENHQFYQQQQQQQECHHDLTLSSSMAGPLTSKDMTTPHSDHNNNNINNTNEIHDTSELSNNTASTNQIASPKQPNLKFKISNRKKKDKNKHTPWWSPPINVLIVEDNMINQAILSTWMKKHKIKYEVASDGKQAVEKWKKGGFHLILMDIQLPVMSGIDATKTIREIEKDKKIGVLPSKWDHVDNGIPKQGDALTNDNTTTTIHVTQENKSHNDIATSTTTATAATTTTINTTNPTSSSNNNEEVEESVLTATATAAAFQSPVIIVALTASSHESDRQAALSAGCNDFLTKPVSLEWLEKKIMEWGCMQALIDVEGWRQWKRITQHSPSSSITQKTPMATATTNLPSITPSSALSTVTLPSSPTDTTTTTIITTAPPNNALDRTSSHSNNSNNNQSIPLSHTHHHHNQHHLHHHKRKEELESISPTLISNNNDINSNHGHGIILQGASTLMNKRVSMKTRMVLRGVDS